MKNRLALLAATLALLAPPMLPAAPIQGPSVVQRFKLPGATGWDFLTFDGAHDRLFITRGDHIVVMDAASGQVTGAISGTPGVHGVALVPGLGKGFASNGKANNITVFDLATLKVRRTIAIKGKKPDAIIHDPASGRVLAFNGESDSMSVIDPASETLVATVPLPGDPEFAAADGKGRVFLNLEDKAKVAVIDTGANKVKETWSLGDCQEPSGLALDAAHHRLFATCQNKRMVVLDTLSGKKVAVIPIGEEPDAAAFDAVTGLVYASCGAGVLTVAHEDDPDHFHVVANVTTQKGARTLALDEKQHRIFLATADFLPAQAGEKRPPVVPGSFTILVVR